MGDTRKVNLHCPVDGQEHEDEEELINHITQLIGTDRIKEAFKLLEVHECKVQRGEIQTDTFEKFMGKLLKRVQGTYKNIIDVNDDPVELKNMYVYKNIEKYTEIVYELLDKPLKESIL